MKHKTVLLSLLLWSAGAYAQSSLTVVNAASGTAMVAPDSLVSAFGKQLSTGAASANAVPLPTTLDGVTVQVTDSTGTARAAALIFVSPTQVNFVLPVGTAAGSATVAVMNGSTATATGTATVQAAAPGLFSASGNGKGVAAAIGIRVVDVVGPHVAFPIFSCKAVNGNAPSCDPLPIDTGLDSPVFLAFFGTGIRNAKNVTVTIGGQTFAALYAGPQGFPGLDQVNVGLPLTLRGAGLVDVVVTADGQASNAVQIQIQ